MCLGQLLLVSLSRYLRRIPCSSHGSQVDETFLTANLEWKELAEQEIFGLGKMKFNGVSLIVDLKDVVAGCLYC